MSTESEAGKTDSGLPQGELDIQVETEDLSSVLHLPGDELIPVPTMSPTGDDGASAACWSATNCQCQPACDSRVGTNRVD